MRLPNARYEPEHFPGVIHQPEESPVTVMIIGTGQVLFDGAQDDEMLRAAHRDFFHNLADWLQGTGLEHDLPEEPPFNYQNIIGHLQLVDAFDLAAVDEAFKNDEALDKLSQNIGGRIYRFTDPPLFIIILGDGRLISGGARSHEDYYRSFLTVLERLHSAGVLTELDEDEYAAAISQLEDTLRRVEETTPDEPSPNEVWFPSMEEVEVPSAEDGGHLQAQARVQVQTHAQTQAHVRLEDVAEVKGEDESAEPELAFAPSAMKERDEGVIAPPDASVVKATLGLSLEPSAEVAADAAGGDEAGAPPTGPLTLDIDTDTDAILPAEETPLERDKGATAPSESDRKEEEEAVEEDETEQEPEPDHDAEALADLADEVAAAFEPIDEEDALEFEATGGVTAEGGAEHFIESGFAREAGHTREHDAEDEGGVQEDFVAEPWRDEYRQMAKQWEYDGFLVDALVSLIEEVDRPTVEERFADARSQIDHLRSLREELTRIDPTPFEAECEALIESTADLAKYEETLARYEVLMEKLEEKAKKDAEEAEKAKLTKKEYLKRTKVASQDLFALAKKLKK